MAKITTLQHFNSVHHLASHYGTTLPSAYKTEWRLLQSPIVGHVNGVESLQGRLVATNGVLAALERAERLEFVHVDFFIADEQEVEVRTLIKKDSVAKTHKAVIKPSVDISEYI